MLLLPIAKESWRLTQLYCFCLSVASSHQIYSPDHTSSSFPSNPSTPVGSPSPLTATAGAASAGTVVTSAGTPSGRSGRAQSLGFHVKSSRRQEFTVKYKLVVDCSSVVIVQKTSMNLLDFFQPVLLSSTPVFFQTKTEKTD